MAPEPGEPSQPRGMWCVVWERPDGFGLLNWMSKMTRLRWLAALASTASVLAGCAPYPYDDPYYGEDQDAVYAPPPANTSVWINAAPAVVEPAPVFVPYGPPPLPVEVIPPRPYVDMMWVPGYWFWRSGWVWTRGRWMRPPHGESSWVRPHYERHDRGITFVPGYWGSRNRMVPREPAMREPYRPPQYVPPPAPAAPWGRGDDRRHDDRGDRQPWPDNRQRSQQEPRYQQAPRQEQGRPPMDDGRYERPRFVPAPQVNQQPVPPMAPVMPRGQEPRYVPPPAVQAQPPQSPGGQGFMRDRITPRYSPPPPPPPPPAPAAQQAQPRPEPGAMRPREERQERPNEGAREQRRDANEQERGRRGFGRREDQDR
jgi:hypothetical protein